MTEQQDIQTLWQIVQEFVSALQRQDPTIRRWLVPGGKTALWLDLYGEEALLILTKDYLDKEHFVLMRDSTPSGQDHRRARLVEAGWVGSSGAEHSEDDLVTFYLRLYHRRWRVEHIWPTPLDAPVSLRQAREIVQARGESAPLAIRLLAGALDLPLEGCGDMDDVEAIFVVGMSTRGYSPSEVIQALGLWRDYRRRAHLSYHKPTIPAAAVEYVLNLLGSYRDTQKEIAAFYGVSPGSVSARYCQIRDRLKLVPFDPRYALLEDT